MKKIRMTFPDGTMWAIDFDFVNRRYASLESLKIGIPYEEIPPIDSGLTNVPTWIKKNLSWHELAPHAERLPDLSQDEKNEINFDAATIKVLES